MSKNKNIIWLAVLAILVLVFFLSKGKDNVEKRKPFIATKQADILKIQITQPADSLHMALENGQWNITTPRIMPVKETQLKRLWDEFLPLTVSTLSVTDSPDRQAFYQVDDETATIVSLLGKNDRILAKVYVGSNQNSPQFSYVRMNGSNNIYQIDNLQGLITTTLSTWREDRIVPLAIEDIFAVAIVRENDPFQISQESGFWTVTAGEVNEVIDPTNSDMSRLLNSISNLRTSTFYYDEYEAYAAKLAVPALGVQITNTARQVVNLTIAKNDENSYVLQKNEDTGTLYRLTNAQFNQLNIASAGFIPVKTAEEE